MAESEIMVYDLMLKSIRRGNGAAGLYDTETKKD